AVFQEYSLRLVFGSSGDDSLLTQHKCKSHKIHSAGGSNSALLITGFMCGSLRLLVAAWPAFQKTPSPVPHPIVRIWLLRASGWQPDRVVRPVCRGERCATHRRHPPLAESSAAAVFPSSASHRDIRCRPHARGANE